MKTIGKSVALASGLAIVALLGSTTSAWAQGFGFGFSTPGVSVGVNSGGFGYYGGYPVVAPAPAYVAPVAPYVVSRPVVVGAPFYGPRPYPYYGPRYRGGGPYRRYPRYWR